MIIRIQDDQDEWISMTDLDNCALWLSKNGYRVLPRDSVSYLDVELYYERDLTFLNLIVRKFGRFEIIILEAGYEL